MHFDTLRSKNFISRIDFSLKFLPAEFWLVGDDLADVAWEPLTRVIYDQGLSIQGNGSCTKVYRDTLHCLCFEAEPQRCVFLRQSRMHKSGCGAAATKKSRIMSLWYKFNIFVLFIFCLITIHSIRIFSEFSLNFPRVFWEFSLNFLRIFTAFAGIVALLPMVSDNYSAEKGNSYMVERMFESSGAAVKLKTKVENVRLRNDGKYEVDYNGVEGRKTGVIFLIFRDFLDFFVALICIKMV